MKKRSSLLICGIFLIISIFFMGCPTDGDDDNSNGNGNGGGGLADGGTDTHPEIPTADEALGKGQEALEQGKFEEALSMFESAYAKDNSNTEALVLSSLGKLASVAWSKEAGDFFTGQLGVTNYPGTLEAFLTFDQPQLSRPTWLDDKKLSLLAGDGDSTDPIILMAYLLTKNPKNLNGVLDDLINKVLNSATIQIAVARIANLKQGDAVEIDGALLQSLGLGGILGEGDKVSVGWAELKLLAGYLQLAKASLEYVNSYSWDYNDISFIQNLPWDETILGQLVENKDLIEQAVKILPFKTNFMKNRGGSWMANSQKDYAAALKSFVEIYDDLPATVKEDLGYNKTDLSALAAAVEGGTSYQVKDPDSGESVVTVNFRYFFTSGQFALDKLIDNDGSSPRFYRVSYDGSGIPVLGAEITNVGDITGPVGFKLNTKQITDVFSGAEELSAIPEVIPLGDDPDDPMVGRIVWYIYKDPSQILDLLALFGSGE